MDATLATLIDRHAENAPDQAAIRFLDQSLSYSELTIRANALAHTLIANGANRGDRIGIYQEKRLESAVAMYGIMKAGCAYVPLDPSAPVNRTASIIGDCGIRQLIVSKSKSDASRSLVKATVNLSHLIGDLPEALNSCRVISWDDVNSASREPAGLPKILDSDLAYIIYTSGSTGAPKGIMHTHYSGLSFARWAAREYDFHRNDRLSNHAPLHFDLSIMDFFAGAVAGATTDIIPEEYTRMPASYSKLIADHEITVLYTVPFALIQLLTKGMLAERDLEALRWVIFGGEPFPPKYLRELMRTLPHARFDNIYGPAEVNGVTHHTIANIEECDGPISIGPIASIAEALVVDENDHPVSKGETGELLVRSPTVMQGYWGQPELNANAFYKRPVGSEYAHIYYRTGDLVRELHSGSFEFLGRKDRQVKVRGYRIELDETEAALAANEFVEEAAAFPVAQSDGTQEIRAAAILRSPGAVAAEELINDLRARLPWYAIPSALTLHNSFPRTSTGKIDRKALRNLVSDAVPETV